MDDRSEVLVKNLKKFIQHVDDMFEEDNPSGNGFNREYIELREIAATNKQENRFPAEHGKLQYNIKKNRYKDIIPFDEQRVILETLEGVDGSDYINASFIMSVHNNEAYIASQGPLPHTVNDFWRMVWENKVKVIMMACREVEANKKKCARYWPESKEEEVRGNIHVRLLSVEDVGNQDDCKERTMSVRHQDSNEMRVVTQYHYTGWPDHGIPDDIDVIMEMMARMRNIRSQDKDFAPVVVHCSAGCGRTGTICAIDYAWEVLKCGKLDENFSMYEIVHSMREQRQSMIQTPDQYEMAHLCVRWLFEKHINVIEENIYANFESSAPTQDDEYSNVTLAEEKDGKEVDPYETVGTGGFNRGTSQAFKIQGNKPSVDPQSLLERECLSTIEVYVNTDSEVTDKLTLPSKKPELKKKPSDALNKENNDKSTDKVEQDNCSDKLKESGKSRGYENVIEKDSYENVGKSDSNNCLKLGVTVNNAERHKPVVTDQPDPSLNVKASPKSKHKDTVVQQSGPLFVSSAPERPIPPKSGPVFQESGPSFVRPKSVQLQKQTSLQGQNVTRIHVGGINPRVSYVGNQPPADNTYGVPNKLQQNQPKTEKNTAPTKPERKNSVRNSASSDQPISSDPGNVYSLASHPETDKKLRSSLNGLKENETDIKPGLSEGAIYSQVSKPGRPASNPPLRTQNTDAYESISDFPNWKTPVSKKQSEGLYSEVQLSEGDSAPAVPERGYRQVENVPPPQVPHVQERKQGTLECGFVRLGPGTSAGFFKGTSNTMMKIQNVFSRGGNSELDSDTSHIPGFKVKLAKKPKGPKDKPHFWNKILK